MSGTETDTEADTEERGPAAALNALPLEEARGALGRCCGARRWVEAMLAARPYPSTESLYARADAIWKALGREDYLEAFAHHPRIGEDLATLRARFPATSSWSSAEQAGVAGAGDAVLEALREANRAYEARFGHVFLVCAQGKSAAEMLALLQARRENPPDRELAIAAAEHAKITHLRLARLSPATPPTRPETRAP